MSKILMMNIIRFLSGQGGDFSIKRKEDTDIFIGVI